jgi:ABC-2 type transport system ATP-binding protein
MIEARDLTKRFGGTVAVDGLSFTVRPGQVTGFLGPNGAGKSTTLRLAMGLDRPTAGIVTVNGRPFREHRDPLRQAGALLDHQSAHRGRTARAHLLGLARTHGIPASRVDDVLAEVGLTGAARRRAGTFSLGMSQRLGIAAALLGDPAVVVLDEPVNGLDPDGVLWIRHLLKGLAADGRTVLVSSHLMSEMALTAERIVVVGRGRLLADTTVDDLVARIGDGAVLVRSPDAGALRDALLPTGATVSSDEPGALTVTGVSARRIGDVARDHRLAVHELTPRRASLEEAYLELTREAVEYR